MALFGVAHKEYLLRLIRFLAPASDKGVVRLPRIRSLLQFRSVACCPLDT